MLTCMLMIFKEIKNEYKILKMIVLKLGKKSKYCYYIHRNLFFLPFFLVIVNAERKKYAFVGFFHVAYF